MLGDNRDSVNGTDRDLPTGSAPAETVRSGETHPHPQACGPQDSDSQDSAVAGTPGPYPPPQPLTRCTLRRAHQARSRVAHPLRAVSKPLFLEPTEMCCISYRHKPLQGLTKLALIKFLGSFCLDRCRRRMLVFSQRRTSPSQPSSSHQS